MSVPNSRPPTDSIKATGDAVTAANEPGRARAYAQVSPAASAVPDPSDALLIAAQPRGQVALAASPWTDSLRRVSSRSGSLTIGATRWLSQGRQNGSYRKSREQSAATAGATVIQQQSAPDLAVPRSLIAFTSPQVPISAHVGAWLSDPARTAGCRELSGVGTLRVPESSACAGAGLLDACCATGPSASGEPMALLPSRAARAGRRHVTTPPQRKPTPGRASPAQFPEVPPGHRVRRLVGSQAELSGRSSGRFGRVRPGQRVSKF